MKPAGISLRSRTAGSGTLFARICAVTFASAALIASGSGYAGCLLGTRIVDDDADLRPFQPPAITDSTIDGRPVPPGTMFIINDTGTANRSVLIDATIMTASRAAVGARWFRDRPRPCIAGSTCTPSFSDQELPPPATGESPNERHTTVQVDNIAPQHCTVIDLFVANNFKFATAEAHEPQRTGEFAFARWFIARFDPANPIPFSDCVRETF